MVKGNSGRKGLLGLTLLLLAGCVDIKVRGDGHSDDHREPLIRIQKDKSPIIDIDKPGVENARKDTTQ